MRTASYGRIVFGASAVLYGAVALLWHGSDTWQFLGKSFWPPAAIAAEALAIAQIAGGFGVLYSRTARPASVVLGAVYALLSLACIPGILAAPAGYVQYGNFFEHLSFACGALAVYAAANGTRSAALGRAARIGLGLCAMSFALEQAFYLRETAGLVPAWIPPNPTFWAILTTAAFALAAVAAIANVRARLAIRLLTVMLVIFGVLVWIPILCAHPQALANWSEFAETFLIAGAAWAVADLSAF